MRRLIGELIGYPWSSVCRRPSTVSNVFSSETAWQGWQNIDRSGFPTWEIPVFPWLGNTLKISKIGKYWEILDEIY